MENKYKINQKVYYANQKCLIIASKSEPYKPDVDRYNRKHRFPEKDYLLFILKDIETEEYFGMEDVYENQIVDITW